MISKKKVFTSLFNIKNIIIFFILFFIEVNAETKIIAKKGDTFFKISKQYGVSLKELMHKNNFNHAHTIVEGEIIIIPGSNSNINSKYKVLEGDTIYKIARQYNVKVKDIISLNNLDKESFLKINQFIILPKGAKINKRKSNIAIKKVFFHQKSKSENLSDIAQIHGLQLEELISLNKSNNSNIKLKIRKNNTSRWIKYGSLNLHWSDWRYFDGNYITEAKNKKKRVFSIAINCKMRTLNNTLINKSWTNWYFPQKDFEYQIINDFCENDFMI